MLSKGFGTLSSATIRSSSQVIYKVFLALPGAPALLRGDSTVLASPGQPHVGTAGAPRQLAPGISPTPRGAYRMGLMGGKVFWIAMGPMSDGEVGTIRRVVGMLVFWLCGLRQCGQNTTNGG